MGVFGLPARAGSTTAIQYSNYIAEEFKIVDGNSISSLSETTSPEEPKIILSKVVATSDLYSLLSIYDWSVEVAYRIAICESGGDSKSHNYSDVTGDDSWGLFQINRYGELGKNRPSADWLIIPENNIKYAYQLYKQVGWSAWSCYNKIYEQTTF